MDRPFEQQFATRSVVMATHGIAATSHPLATQIAVQLLRQGGSAVDAAIGANAALGLMEPTGAGVGGDLFAIVWDAEHRQLRGLNASGRSPLSLTLEHLQSLGLEQIPRYGPLAVSVPGAVDGWSELHAAFGRLELAELFAPAIEYAEQGFGVTEVIAADWAADAALFKEYPVSPTCSCPAGELRSRESFSEIPDSRRPIARLRMVGATLSTKAIWPSR